MKLEQRGLSESERSLVWWALLFPWYGFAALVGAMAIVREISLFWRNEGGYPIWLREFVLYAYYPSLIFTVGWFGYLCVRTLQTSSRRGATVQWLALAPAVLILLMIGVITLY